MRLAAGQGARGWRVPAVIAAVVAACVAFGAANAPARAAAGAPAAEAPAADAATGGASAPEGGGTAPGGQAPSSGGTSEGNAGQGEAGDPEQTGGAVHSEEEERRLARRQARERQRRARERRERERREAARRRAAERHEREAAQGPAPSGPNVRDIPRSYLAAYRRAAKQYRLDWRLLAAIGKRESDHGRARLPGVRSGVNFAGCCAGPMQFCVVDGCGNTWRAYAVDGDGDGRRSVYDPDDAILTAARYVAGLQKMVGKNPSRVMAAYNAGPGNVLRHNGVPPFSETRNYVRLGLQYMRGLGKG